MTDDELKEIEARAAFVREHRPEDANADVLALVAEVRRLRAERDAPGHLNGFARYVRAEAARRAAEHHERCPARESGGVQCELPAGHEGEHACPEALARAALLTCEHANTITKPEDETFLDRLGCLDCGVWLQPVRTKRT